MPMPAKVQACPECGAETKRGTKVCEACGAEVGPRRPPPPQEASDASKYAAIIGALVVIIAIVWFVAGGMGGSKDCLDCKGGTIVCTNCKSGTPKCVGCRGSGKDPQTFSTCARCGGKGEEAVCSKCRGTPKTRCASCGGDGVLEQD